MSDIRNSSALVQVTSFDVLLNNGMRINWQGFRPAGANAVDPTTYFTTLPGNGTGETEVSMLEIGAQASDFPVEVTLLSGKASLDGKPLEVGVAVSLSGVGSGEPAKLVYGGDSCSLKACPKRSGPTASAESGAVVARSGGGGEGGTPPPPLPGNNGND